MLIEICCENLQYAIDAHSAGVKRIEYCSGLAIGGLSPQASEIKYLKQNTGLELMALVRPHSGGFDYSTDEQKMMLETIESFLKAGADGIVVGALNPEKTINQSFMSAVTALCEDVSITFHRAFDFVEDPLLSMKVLQELGVDRILTSGHSPSAIEGQERLQSLLDCAEGNIIILPGAGITSTNVKILLRLDGLEEIHLSAKQVKRLSSLPFETFEYSFDQKEYKKILEIIQEAPQR